MIRLCLILCFLLLPAAARAQQSLLTETPKTHEILIETAGGKAHAFQVELAVTAQEQINGLMHRTSMPPDHGMLFLGDRETPKAFWMKNTLISLDMIFIRANGTIHHIHPRAIPLDLTPVPSNGPVLAVLELNGGTAERLGIAPGDKVRFHAFGNTVVK